MGGRSSSSGTGAGASSGLRDGWDPFKVNASQCQTKEELIDYFDKVYSITVEKDIFDHVRFDVAKYGLIGIEEMMAEVGTYVDLKTIGVDPTHDSIAYCTAGGDRICFANYLTEANMKSDAYTWLGNFDETTYLRYMGYEPGIADYHPKAKTFTLEDCVKQVMAHETAHAYENYLALIHKGRASTRAGVSKAIVIQAYKNIYGKNANFESFTDQPSENGHFQKMCNNISGYANKHEVYKSTGRMNHYFWETWSEAHADVYSNKGNADVFSKEIVRLAEETRKGNFKV